MANQFLLPFRRAFSATGAVAPGAQVRFDITGTTTKTPVYTTTDLSIPHDNPVIANAAGIFPDIFLDPAVTYRVRLYDKDDTLLDDLDPYTLLFEDSALDALDEVVELTNANVVASREWATKTDGPPDPVNYPGLLSSLASAISASASAASALASQELAEHYANDDTNVDVPGGSVGDRGAKYYANLLGEQLENIFARLDALESGVPVEFPSFAFDDDRNGQYYALVF